ncbi:MAG: hypothetical protein IT333_00405 [Thermomicrobiales bacterium]|nr:hypothetical protein [Thermomicrobiales bacterium]
MMKHRERLFQTYADLFPSDADEALGEVINQLDAAGSGYRSIQPPVRLRHDPRWQHVSTAKAGGSQQDSPDLQSIDLVSAADDIAHGTRRIRSRQIWEMAAAIAIFAITAAVLIAVFGGRDSHIRVATPAGDTGSLTYQGLDLQSRDGEFISLEDATQRMRVFLNEELATVTGRLVNPRQEDGNLMSHQPDVSLYLLSRSASDSAPPDTFVVDADTGDVLQAVLLAGIGKMTGPLEAADARSIAETFASNHFSGFDQLTAVDSWLAQPDTSYLSDLGQYDVAFRSSGFDASSRPGMQVFHWRQYSDRNEGWLSTFVSVGVNQQTGRVVYYAGRHADDAELRAPTLSREEAIQIAISHTREVSPGLADVTVGQVDLVTRFRDAWQDRWLWVVEVVGSGSSDAEERFDERPRYWGIDAITGEVVEGALVSNSPAITVEPSPTE